MQQKYCAAQSSADRISLFPVRLPRTRQPSAFGRGRVLCRLARALAEFPRLLGQHLHLALDIVRLQSQHVLDVSRPHQLLGKFERARDVSLGESHRLFGYVLGALAGGLGLTFEGAHGLVRRGNKAVEGLPRLVDALFGKRPHFRGNIETIVGGHTHLLCGVGCYAGEARNLLKYQRPNRPSAPARTKVCGSGPSTLRTALPSVARKSPITRRSKRGRALATHRLTHHFLSEKQTRFFFS